MGTGGQKQRLFPFFCTDSLNDFFSTFQLLIPCGNDINSEKDLRDPCIYSKGHSREKRSSWVHNSFSNHTCSMSTANQVGAG
jgi:hypothetical protein